MDQQTEGTEEQHEDEDVEAHGYRVPSVADPSSGTTDGAQIKRGEEDDDDDDDADVEGHRSHHSDARLKSSVRPLA